MKTKIIIAVSMLLLSACVYVPAPTPAPLTGTGSEKAKVMQLNQNVREALGSKNKDEIIIRIGVDGTITLYGAEGQGFKVEDVKNLDAKEYDTDKSNKMVVNRVMITTVRNSPECNNIIFAGKKYWYPSPDCPH